MLLRDERSCQAYTLRDGRFLILGKAAEDQVLVQHPSSSKPEAMTRAEFEAIWDGRLVLMARRATFSGRH
jgi:subfamily B ATP-binding cassette protein HlyB/CyaB